MNNPFHWAALLTSMSCFAFGVVDLGNILLGAAAIIGGVHYSVNKN